MYGRIKELTRLAFLSLSLAFIGSIISIAGGSQAMAEATDNSSPLKMSYRLEGAYSAYKYIQIEISSNGKGKLEYELYREYVSENERKQRTVFLRIDETKIKELIALYKKVDFCNLNLSEAKAYVTDVGTTILTYHCQDKEKRLSYTYLKDNPLKELVKFYSRLAMRYLPPTQRLRNY